MNWSLTLALAALPLFTLLAGCELPAPVEAAVESTDHQNHAAEERDPNRLWCAEHSVYEDECYICHPELEPKESSDSPEDRDPNRLWCAEHGLYEDECEICHPGITAGKEELTEDEHADHDHGGHDNGSHGERDGVLWCNEHDLAETECGTCQPQLLADLPVGTGMKLRVAEPAALQLAGLDTTMPETGDAASAQEILGRITYNRNELAVVTPLAPGVVTEVNVDVGEKVDPNELLAVVRAPEITEGATAYLKAIADADYKRKVYERERDLFEKEISARQDYEAAEADWQASQSEVNHGRQHLLNLGMTEEEVDTLKTGGRYSGEMSVRAPFAGTVVEREAVMGTAVEPGDELFRVADLSSMWLALSVPESRLSALEDGALLQVRVDAYPGIVFEGTISWIGSSVHPETRMVEARATLPNPQGLLKDGMFAQAKLSAAIQASRLTVPQEAVQMIDGRPIVFAQLEEDLYEARLVDLGGSQGSQVAVLAGLAPGERVVTGETYVLKSELLKGRLGAGCADH